MKGPQLSWCEPILKKLSPWYFMLTEGLWEYIQSGCQGYRQHPIRCNRSLQWAIFEPEFNSNPSEALPWFNCRLKELSKYCWQQLHYRHWWDSEVISKTLLFRLVKARFHTFWARKEHQFFSHRDPHPWELFWEDRKGTRWFIWCGCSPWFWLQELVGKGCFYPWRPK